jgi:hypothetical protein
VGRKSKLPQSITTKNTEQKAEYRLFFPIFANVVIFLTKQAKPNGNYSGRAGFPPHAISLISIFDESML